MNFDRQPFPTMDFVNRMMVTQLVGWKPPADDGTKARVHTPAWHIGHAAIDYHKALLEPFGIAPELASYYPPDEFTTMIQVEPWGESFTPSTEGVAQWFWKIDELGRDVIASKDWKMELAQPVDFFTQSVRTVEDAVYYMIMHNSFHFGRAVAETG